MKTVYGGFGLTETEISLIASATMKRDYFYTSPMGRRLFQLDLGRLTLSLIGAPDHALLDSLASRYEPGSALCAEILAAKRFNFKRYLGENAPVDPEPMPRQSKIQNYSVPAQLEVNTESAPEKLPVPAIEEKNKNADFLDAVAALPERKNNDGQGRAAETVAKKFGVSVSTVYQARTVLKHGIPELIGALRRGELPVKTAYKRLLKEGVQKTQVLNEQAAG